ncbi:hypothetical protein MESS4_140009 [Mesorhizobium sp. STM 4661]|nr:hypothetical protein MESS4_140009 [Mesorhizobium sp. STM 4661]
MRPFGRTKYALTLFIHALAYSVRRVSQAGKWRLCVWWRGARVSHGADPTPENGEPACECTR